MIQKPQQQKTLLRKLFSWRKSPWAPLFVAIVMLTLSAPVLYAASNINYTTCHGSHCTAVGAWNAGPPVRLLLHATLNMDTILRGPATPPTCTAGSSFELPITSTGELTGMATAYFDSPPITFTGDYAGQARVVTAATDGILCRQPSGYGARELCALPLSQAQSKVPLLGTWNDKVEARYVDSTNKPNITCEPVAADRARCTVTDNTSGRIEVKLTRTVPYFTWSGNPPIEAGAGGRVADLESLLAPLTSTVRMTCPQQFPNLTVIEPKHTPAQPKVGDAIALEATVLSNGTAPTTRATTATARLDRGADGTYEETLDPKSVPALAINGRHLLQWPDAWVMTPGTHRYQICIDPQNLIAEFSEQDNCITRSVVIAPPSGPDLALVHGVGVANVNNLVVGQPTTLSTIVFNISTTAAAGASTTGATVGGVQVGTVPTNALPAARFHEISLAWTPTIPGPQTVTICADTANVVSEANEDNNCAFRTVTVTGPPTSTGPDLSVVATSFTTSSFRVGQPTTINSFVVNSGQQAVTVPTTATLTTNDPAANITVQPLPVQKFERISLTWTPATTGTQVIRLCADSTNIVTETNEDNNCDQRTVTVTDDSTAVGPDLALVHGVGVPNTLVVGQPAELSTIVFNISTTAAAGASITAASIGDTQVATTPTNALPPARFHEVKMIWTPAIAGPQTITLCADDTEVVQETNETNNCDQRTVTVTTSTPTDNPAPRPGPIRETE